MAIELVIKLSEEDYEIMKHNISVNNPLCPLSQEEMVAIVANGIPLKRGHGDLIDRDDLLVDSYYTVDLSGTEINIVDVMTVEMADAIIEADKEQK